MPPSDAVARCGRAYARWLALYPAAYRARFGAAQLQAFEDRCRAAQHQGRGLVPVVLWMFVETGLAMAGEHARSPAMRRSVLRVAAFTAAVLLVPLVGTLVSDEWQWDLADFVFMCGLLFGAGMAFAWVSSFATTRAYRIATAIAAVTTVLLIWVNAAVGIIGDGPVNLLFLAVPLVLVAGVALARLRARGMVRALLATALVQVAIPVIALLQPPPSFAPGVLPVMALNGGFVLAWLLAAWLYHHAGYATTRQPQAPG